MYYSLNTRVQRSSEDVPSALHVNQPGQASDIDIQAREILRMRESLNQILTDLTGQTLEKIAEAQMCPKSTITR